MAEEEDEGAGIPEKGLRKPWGEYGMKWLRCGISTGFERFGTRLSVSGMVYA